MRRTFLALAAFVVARTHALSAVVNKGATSGRTGGLFDKLQDGIAAKNAEALAIKEGKSLVGKEKGLKALTVCPTATMREKGGVLAKLVEREGAVGLRGALSKETCGALRAWIDGESERAKAEVSAGDVPFDARFGGDTWVVDYYKFQISRDGFSGPGYTWTESATALDNGIGDYFDLLRRSRLAAARIFFVFWARNAFATTDRGRAGFEHDGRAVPRRRDRGAGPQGPRRGLRRELRGRRRLHVQGRRPAPRAAQGGAAPRRRLRVRRRRRGQGRARRVRLPRLRLSLIHI